MTVEEKREQSLQKANAHRIAKADIRRRIRTGELSMYDVLENPPEELWNTHIVKVLCMTPGIQTKRAIDLCRNLVSGTMPLGDIGLQTRQVLSHRLSKRAYGRTIKLTAPTAARRETALVAA